MVRSLQRTAREFSGVKLCVYLSPACGACVNGELRGKLQLRSVHRLNSKKNL